MPLVVVTGLPCSGKTRAAEKLVEAFRQSTSVVHLLNEESLLIDRRQAYKDSAAEKQVRGTIKAAVERLLTREAVVIADSLNYIKGFRYELYCIARAIETTPCTMWCDVSEETARERNAAREPEQRYPDDVLDGLVMRYEMPDPRNRWDAPLFIVGELEDAPVSDVVDGLLRGRAPRAHLSTRPQRMSETNYLYEVDQATQEIVTAVADAQQAGALPGDSIPVPKASSLVQLDRKVSIIELRKLRRQFLKIAQLKPPSEVAQIGNLFVEYINTTLAAS